MRRALFALCHVMSIPLRDIRAALRRHKTGRVPGSRLMKRAAVSAILRERAGDTELMFIRRAEHPRDPWSGHMAWPGGRVDPEDSSPFAAALRETREEISLDLDAAGDHIGRLSQQPALGRGRALGLVVDPFVFALRGQQRPLELEPDPREVQEVVWVPLRFLLDRSHRSTMKRTFAGVPWTLPCYRFEGRLIWGLTLKMADELLGLLS